METNKFKIDKKYLPALGRVFTPIVMDNLSQKGYSGYLSEVCTNSGLLKKIDTSMTLGQFFDWVYNLLFKSYRNEYIYKNVIAHKILLGRHSLNTSRMLTEFRVDKSKADVVILNGTSTVYEIKSEYDSFVRLKKQIQAYFKVFDYINVITSPSQAEKLKTILPDNAGIFVLTKKNTITTIRDSQSNKKNINTSILFNSLRKAEYTEIIKGYYGKIPDVPNTLIYRECKELFCKMQPVIAHDLVVKTLRKRGNLTVLKEFIDNAPSSLLAYAMSNGNEKKKLYNLIPKFEIDIKSILNPKFI